VSARSPQGNERSPPAPGIAPGALTALLGELVRAPAAERGAAWERWLAPNAMVGRYRMVREIGRGGFGVVWEAVETSSGREVAFKAVRAGGLSALRGERLLREAELAARLIDPNIVELLDAGRDEHGPWLVFELLRGLTLAQRLEAGPMPGRDALRVVLDVARALSRAHAEGVVHRDLTPGNVFLCEGGRVKVLDFGLAHAFGRRKVDGGTPAWMAPEQRRGAPEDERTDVYALGLLLFRLLGDRLPTPDASGAPPRLQFPASPGLGTLGARMLAWDPVDRPRDAGEVLAALAEAAAPLLAADREPEVQVLDRSPPATPAVDVRALEYCERGRTYLRETRRRSLEFARDMFARAVEVAPSHAPAHAGLAEALAQLHAYYPPAEGALAVADRESARALELAPELAGAHAARGYALFLLGRGAEADRAFARAFDLDPGLFEGWYYAGRAAFQTGRYPEAARLFGEASRVRPDYAAAFFAAQATEALGERPEARQRYHRALELVEAHMDLHPDDSRAATMRAVSLIRTGRALEGLRWAEEALTLEPQDPGIRYNVACLYALEGERERALDHLEEVVRRGFRNRDWMERDPDLAGLRTEPRFQALMESIGRPAASPG